MVADFPLPDTEWERTREFWRAAARGELVLPHCAACRRIAWYPPERCPACGHPTLEWKPVSGRGSVYSWAVVRHAFLPAFREQIPYVTGLVSLDEDPSVRLVTRFVECNPETLVPELAVEAVFRPLVFPGVERRIVAPLFKPTG
ncbi:MAG: Zn-ribbon domain-containing OB-fold protein [Myxococcota bacterium]